MQIVPFHETYRNQIEIFLKKDSFTPRIIWDNTLNDKQDIPNIFLAMENNEIKGILSFFMPFSIELELYPILEEDVFPDLLATVKTFIDFSSLERVLIVLNEQATTEKKLLHSYLLSDPEIEYEMSYPLKKRELVSVPLTIRQSTTKDLDDLAILNADIFEEPYVETKNFLQRRTQQEGVTLYIGEMNGSMVGSATIKTKKGTSFLTGFGVLHHSRHKGYGRAFLAALVNTLYKEEISTLSLNVHSENTAALHLYKSFGFTTEDSEHYYVMK